MNHLLITIISSLLVLVGVIGSVLPSLPGPPMALIGLILYAWVTRFHTVSLLWLTIFLIMTLVSILFDIFGPGLMAKGYKTSTYGSWGAVAGGVLGLVSLRPLGAFVGPFLGAFLGEYYASYNAHQAVRSAWVAFVAVLI